MKTTFKPLALAAAVAAASTGYAGVANATSVASNGIGDLALIPYYTVQEGFGTGVHVINTSNRTQVVKLRFRRGSDSLDALDFNLIMSPYDEWTGFLSDDAGTTAITTQDTTCTAPIFPGGRFEMPNIYRSGAEEGYVEVIQMGSPALETSASSPVVPVDGSFVSVAAKHAPGGAPANCQFVEDNFLDAYLGSASDPRGVHNNTTTAGLQDFLPVGKPDGKPDLAVTTYEDGGDALKVSWFIRDANAGLEFGSDAVHISEWSENDGDAWMSHQEQGVFSGNLRGFDFPDLNGNAPFETSGQPAWIAGDWTNTGSLNNELRDEDVLGVDAIINDWSDNPDLNVGTDWIITLPGQYVMLDQPLYGQTLGNRGGLDPNEPGGIVGGGVDEDGKPIVCGVGCDFRDIPVQAEFSVWDREENEANSPPGDRDVVISPSIPGTPKPTSLLRYEVNIVHWGEEVMDSQYDEVNVDGLTDLLLPAVSGWAKLKIASRTAAGGASVQGICNWDGEYFNDPRNLPVVGDLYDPNDPMDCTTEATGKAPMIGFVAWERSFPSNPDGNYGRAVRHSFESGTVIAPPGT